MCDAHFEYFTSLLRKELIYAMGCTEPAAAALAGAKAREALDCTPEHIAVKASRDIIKNAMHVGIPNSSLKGIAAAVALGVAAGNTGKGLNILSGISPAEEAQGVDFLARGIIKLELAEQVPSIFIEVMLEGGGKRVRARVEQEHTNVFMVEDGAAAYTGQPVNAPGEENRSMLHLPDILAYAGSVPFEDIQFILDAARTNLALAKHSIKTGYGIAVGPAMESGRNQGSLDDLFNHCAVLAAAGSDARMAGCSMPVVINSGSGNQGITILVPVMVLGEGLHVDDIRLARALCLASLTALMITHHKERLSALCGAFTAAMGTAAGFIYLLEGDIRDIERVINTMMGNLAGILCDGAKSTCALKIYSCVQAAALSAKLVMAGRSAPDTEGIIGKDIEDTLDIIRKISHEGMVSLDETILEIMIDKNKRE